MPSDEAKLDRAHHIWPKAIAAADWLYQRAGLPVMGVAGACALVFVSFHARAPLPHGAPGPGVVVQTDVTVVWVPRAVRDFALGQGRAPVQTSLAAVQTELKRRGVNDAWYAIEHRGAHSGQIMQTRRLSEAGEHLVEFQAMMATAAGRRGDGRDSGQVRVEIIPDAYQSLDPREAMARLTSEPVAPNESLPGRDPFHPRRSEQREADGTRGVPDTSVP
jgi:hypothetical protein